MQIFYIQLDLYHTNVDANLSNYTARLSTASVGRNVNKFLFEKISITDTEIWFSTDKNGTIEIPSKKVYWSSVNKLFAFDIEIPSVSSTSTTTIYMQVGYKPAGYDENPYAASSTMLLPLMEDALDSTSNGNDGTTAMTIGSETGPDGYLPATYFTGTNRIDIAAGNILFSSADDAAWELWFYDEAISATEEQLVEAGGPTQGISLYLDNGLLYGLFDHVNIAYSASSSYTTGQWNHAVVSREDSGPLTLYLNGVAVSTNNTVVNITSYGSDLGGIGSNNNTFRLANQSTISDNTARFTGNMSNVRSVNSQISAEEVKLNYALQGPNASDNWDADISFVGTVIV